jgi:outer membrane protein assembly factor BamB
MMRNPFVAGCAVAAVVALAASGCGQAAASATAHVAAASNAVAPKAAAPVCPTATWALKVTDAGHLVWKARLPSSPTGLVSTGTLAPVLIGGVALFAGNTDVTAVRGSDGRLLWQRSLAVAESGLYGNSYILGLWQWRGNVIVLVDQYGSGVRLLSLNPATGAVGWTLRLGSTQVVYDTEALASGGVLAFAQGGTLRAADLTTGRLLWSRKFGAQSGPGGLAGLGTEVTAAGQAVVALVGATKPTATTGTITGFDARTGKVLWTRSGIPALPVLTSGDGIVLVYNTFGSDPEPKVFPVTGLSPATGKTLWQVLPKGLIRGLWTGPGGIVFGGGGRLYLADPKKGLLWSAPGAPNDALVTATDVIYLQWVPGPTVNTQLTDVFDRRRSNATERWVRTDSADSLALPAGPDFLLLEPPGLDARSLQAGALKGDTELPVDSSQVTAAVTVVGGDALLQLDPFICVSAG